MPNVRTTADPPASPGEELCDAVRADDVGRVRQLLAAGYDPNAPDLRLGADGAHSLVDAANGGHCELIAILLAAGASVNRRTASGWTALMRACNAGHVAAARMLIDAGADVKARNDEGYTAWGRTPGPCHELATLLADLGGDEPR